MKTTLFQLMNAPVYQTEGGEILDVYSCGDGDSEILITGTNAAELSAYLSELTASGYALRSDYSFDGCTFAEYRDNAHSLHLSYTPKNEAVRLVFGEIPTVDPLCVEPIAELRVEPQLTMMTIRMGLSIVIRTEDGGFIVLDGGYRSEEDMIELRRYLYDNNPHGGKPIIHAWMISHTHVDHMLLATDFLDRFHDDIDLRATVFNFTDFSLPMGYDNPTSEKVRVDRYLKLLETHFPNRRHYRCHTGEVMRFPGLEIRTLATHEDNYPNPLDHFNQASCAWKLTFASGKTVMLMGDTWRAVCKQMSEVYSAELLKCDVLQVTHHGLYGGNLELYQKIDPDICLWATPKANFIGQRTTPNEPDYTKVDQPCVGYDAAGNPVAAYNRWLRDESVRVRTHYCYDGAHTVLSMK